MEKSPRRFGILFYLLIFGAILFLLMGFFGSDEKSDISYSELNTLFREEKVKSFVWEKGILTLTLHEQDAKGRDELTHKLADVEMFHDDLGRIYEAQLRDGIIEHYEFVPVEATPWYMAVLPYLLVTVVVMVVFFVIMGRSNRGDAAGARFAKANFRVGSGSKRVTFDDVAGADEEKEELQEIVDFLRNPEKYRRIGARIPKGVLLIGPPGTGKTLIAKAVAGEAGVQFLSISGSDLVELCVGVGASRVRDLFEQAKKGAPTILFIDEIDAVGRRRGAGLGGGHDEREQTLNQLLVEMDGFSSNEGVIVMAATNRHDILDPALLRPGRFDRQIYVSAPDVKGREEILHVHARDKLLAEDVDLKVIARATGGFTGADLENLLNEAALYSARQEQPVINMEALEASMLKVIAGPEKRSRVQRKQDIRITAFHEAGHAIAMHFLPTQDPVHQITVIPRGKTLGMTIHLPEEDTSHWTRNQMLEEIVSLLGGRVAEAIEFNDISTGASNDLQRASRIAHDMIARYGMSQRIGAVSYDNGDEIFIGRDYERTKSYSEQTGGQIDDEMKRVIDAAYVRCEKILRENYAKLKEVAEYLMEHETMSRKQFEACMKGEWIPTQAESFFRQPDVQSQDSDSVQ